MDLLTLSQAAFLGFVEGLTEFLPVSSTGHLLIFDELIGFRGPPGKVFEIVVQLGAILAVCWLYRRRLVDATVGLTTDPAARAFARNVILAFLPAMVIGFFAHGYIKSVLFNPWVVSVSFIVGGVAILLIERMVHTARWHEVEAMPSHVSLRIGLFQCLAMVPGVSRSGATIMGALLMNVDRRTAAEFSFFLAIPTMLAATAYDIFKSRAVLTLDGLGLIAVGFVVAFVSALVVVKLFIAFVSNHGFAPFAYYRIAAGVAVLAVLLMR
ncbi:MAG: undecaprenyl-diphosphate phosphatase [Alphaproteobacteria bacterium]